MQVIRNAFRSVFGRFPRLVHCLSSLYATAIVFCFPLLAMAAPPEEKEPMEWVLSYFFVLLTLGLAVLILLRPSNRAETAFTQEELDRRREEEMKKLRAH